MLGSHNERLRERKGPRGKGSPHHTQNRHYLNMTRRAEATSQKYRTHRSPARRPPRLGRPPLKNRVDLTHEPAIPHNHALAQRGRMCQIRVFRTKFQATYLSLFPFLKSSYDACKLSSLATSFKKIMSCRVLNTIACK